MKNLKMPLAVLLIVITAVSCRKSENEFQQPQVATEETVSAASLPEGITKSDWQSAPAWNKVEQPTYSIYTSNIKGDISAESAEQGLIRVFKTPSGDHSSPIALPFEETVNGQKQYWYYQVTEGNVMIAVDVYGSKAITPADQSQFQLVVVNKDAISSFEGKGTSRANLMDLSYDKITVGN
jgi:hypothetical protein